MFYFQKQITNIDVDIYRANEFYINLKIVCFFILFFFQQHERLSILPTILKIYTFHENMIHYLVV